MMAIKERLTSLGIRPSIQRVAVMQYLLKHRTHPTVDEIYTALAKEMPTLSRTTIYNTLHILYRHGAVLALCMDGINAHFDGYTHPHAHFMCTHCGKVFDVDLEDVSFMEGNKPKNASCITDTQLYYKGICTECETKANN